MVIRVTTLKQRPVVKEKFLRGPGYQACGNSCYNLNNQSCCQNKVYNGLGYRACGDSCYDPKTETCCKGKIIDGIKDCVY